LPEFKASLAAALEQAAAQQKALDAFVNDPAPSETELANADPSMLEGFGD
jgi:hypothetical protein